MKIENKNLQDLSQLSDLSNYKDDIFAGVKDKKIYLINSKTGQIFKTYEWMFNIRVLCAPKSQSYLSLIITGDTEGQIQFWNMVSGVRENIFAHDSHILDIKHIFTTHMEYIISHGSDKCFKSWKLTTKDLLNSFRYDGMFPIKFMKYFPKFDKNYIVLTLNQKIMLWSFSKYASLSVQTVKDYNLDNTSEKCMISQVEHLESFSKHMFAIAFVNKTIKIADLHKLSVLKTFEKMSDFVYYNSHNWKSDTIVAKDAVNPTHYNLINLKTYEISHRIEAFDTAKISFIKGFTIFNLPLLCLISTDGLLKIVSPHPSNKNMYFVEQSDKNITKMEVYQLNGIIVLSDLSNVHVVNFGNSNELQSY